MLTARHQAGNRTLYAAIGANLGYSSSPASAVLDRLDPRVGEGYVWVTHLGLLPASSDRRRLADGAVVVRVSRSGAEYEVFALADGVEEQLEHYSSTP